MRGRKRRWSREQLEGALRGSVDEQLDALASLPEVIDEPLAKLVALATVEFFNARNLPWFDLPASVIRLVVERLGFGTPAAWTAFVRQAIDVTRDDAFVESAWRTARLALAELEEPGGSQRFEWGSRKHRATLGGLARSPVVLAATQAAVVASPELSPVTQASTVMVAVLLADGSEASMDALLPHVHRAMNQRSALLDELLSLSVYAADTPAAQQLLELLRAHLRQRNEQSPALAWARRQGFDVPSFTVELSLNTGQARTERGWECNIVIDSTAPTWFGVGLGYRPNRYPLVPQTLWHNTTLLSDEHQLGLCTLDELPRWLAAAERKLNLQWSRAPRRPPLKGKQREALLTWLWSGCDEG